MDDFHKVAVMGAVLEHFHKATDADARITWDDVKGYGYEDAQRAIEEHRREKGSQAWRPDPRRIKALAASYYRERQRDRWDAERTIDYLRRQPESARMLHGLPDAEAIEAHYTTAWGMVESSTEEGIGRNVARSYILGGARQAFVQIGLNDAEAERRARECVELSPGEKIPRSPLFREPPKPQTAWNTMKELAAVEHGGHAA